MSHASRHQSDRRKLVRLRQLGLQFHAFRDVVDDDETADHAELARNQRCNRDVYPACFPSRSIQPELVEIVDSCILSFVVKLLDKSRRHNLAEGTAHRTPARQSVHHLHLRVPGFDAVFKINRQNADAD